MPMESMVSMILWLTLPRFFRSSFDVKRCSPLARTISFATASPKAGIQLKGGRSFPSTILNSDASERSRSMGRNSMPRLSLKSPRRYISAATSMTVALPFSTAVECSSAAMRASSAFCDSSPFRMTGALKDPSARMVKYAA